MLKYSSGSCLQSFFKNEGFGSKSIECFCVLILPEINLNYIYVTVIKIIETLMDNKKDMLKVKI